MSDDRRPDAAARHGQYEAAFASGHRFRLHHHPGTFRLSSAGLALGNHLAAALRESELAGQVLEVGTGSGAIALLLRALGAQSVHATDICAGAVATARTNEAANFAASSIRFSHCDLFPPKGSGSPDAFDLVVFNPPGWRAPPESLRAGLSGLDLDAMFFGDEVLLRFLAQLPEHLAAGGRAVVGLNSLVGVEDVLRRARLGAAQGTSLNVRVLERHEFPLLCYTRQWERARALLIAGFELGRAQYGAAYLDGSDTIRWFYEITEITVSGTAASPAASASVTPASATPVVPVAAG